MTDPNGPTHTTTTDDDAGLTSAQAAAVREVQRGSAGDVRHAAAVVHGLGLGLASLAIAAFLVTVLSGWALFTWSMDTFVVIQSADPITAFTEQNHGTVVLVHVISACLAILGLAGYLVAHARYNRAVRPLTRDNAAEPQPSQLPDDYRSAWRTPVAALWIAPMLVALLGAFLLGVALPAKPSATRVVNERLATGLHDSAPREFDPSSRSDPSPGVREASERGPLDGPPSSAESDGLVPTPRHLRDPREREAWALHTLVLPIAIALLSLGLVAVVHSLQVGRTSVRNRKRARRTARAASRATVDG